MKRLFCPFVLLCLNAFAMVEPMEKADFEVLKKIVAGEEVSIDEAQNTRIYTAVKTAAAAQPQNLLDLGVLAQKIADKLNSTGRTDDESILQAMAMFKNVEANQIHYNDHVHSEQEIAALKKIEALSALFKSKH